MRETNVASQPKLSFQKRLLVFRTALLFKQLIDTRFLSAKNEVLFPEFFLQVFDLPIFSTGFREGYRKIEDLHKPIKRR